MGATSRENSEDRAEGSPGGQGADHGRQKGLMETLYRSLFRAELVRTAAAICASDVEAEDIAQDAFIEDWDWQPSIGEEGRDDGGPQAASEERMSERAKGRLRTKVVWRARTARSREGRRAAREGQILYEYRLARSGEGDPEEEYRRRRCAELLGQAVAALSKEERAAWLLVRERGRSYAKAARALGCSPKAVEQRLYRARLRLRSWLESRGIRSLDDVG